MDGPVAARLARCPVEGLEELVRAQTRTTKSISAAKALVAQVLQELSVAYKLITSPHPSDPASLELTTRKLIVTAGLLARHLTERGAFEEALPAFVDTIFLPLLLRRESSFDVLRYEGILMISHHLCVK